MFFLGLSGTHWKDVLVPLSSAAIGALATLLVATTGYWSKSRELDIKMLNIALGILREDPEKSKIAAARGWAVDVINASAPVKIPPDARKQLIENRVEIRLSSGKFSQLPDNLRDQINHQSKQNLQNFERGLIDGKARRVFDQ